MVAVIEIEIAFFMGELFISSSTDTTTFHRTTVQKEVFTRISYLSLSTDIVPKS